MSIPNLLNKIKGTGGIDKVTIMYLFIVGGVGIASFGLGRLSVLDTHIQPALTITGQSASAIASSSSANKTSSPSSTVITQSGIQKKYLASKNGKLYYPSSCKASNRIKEENRVWFESPQDAERAGYTSSASCK